MRHDPELGVDGSTIPYVDAGGGGIHARALFLLQDPSQVAADTTRLISPDNPDPTADNFTWLRDQAGLDPSICLHWNVVPWFIGKRDATAEARRARPWLERFLTELTDLRVVVCMGNHARDAWNALHPDQQCLPGWLLPRDVPRVPPLVLWCPHTSFHNIDGGHAKRLKDGLTPTERILATLAEARTRAAAG